MESIEIREVIEIDAILENWDRNKQTPTQSQQSKKNLQKFTNTIDNHIKPNNTEKTQTKHTDPYTTHSFF